MAVESILKPMYHCTCEGCHHVWEAEKLPDRCASCKRRTWNGTDKRRKPVDNVVKTIATRIVNKPAKA